MTAPSPLAVAYAQGVADGIARGYGDNLPWPDFGDHDVAWRYLCGHFDGQTATFRAREASKVRRVERERAARLAESVRYGLQSATTPAGQAFMVYAHHTLTDGIRALADVFLNPRRIYGRPDRLP